jgi:hypothetical protein
MQNDLQAKAANDQLDYRARLARMRLQHERTDAAGRGGRP